jgi:hypothetical protein
MKTLAAEKLETIRKKKTLHSSNQWKKITVLSDISLCMY